MSRPNAVVWRHVVDDLTSALEVAVGFAAQTRRSAQTTAAEAARLENSIARAVTVLKRAQSKQSQKRGR